MSAPILSPAALVALLALLCGAAPLRAQCVEGRTSSPIGANGRFGADLAVDGNDLIVGAPGLSAVLFYRRSGTTWALAGAPVFGPAGTGYGSSVAVANGVAFVGLPKRASGGLVDSGAVQVFTSTAPGVWTSTGVFSSATPATGGRFGHAVDTDGQRVIVGEPGFNNAKGRFHVFTIGAGGAVTLEQTQSSPNAGVGSQVGHSVAIDGDAAAAGAPYADFSGFTDNGLGAFFRRTQAGIWAQKGVWSYNGSGMNSGWSIDVDGNLGIAGAPHLASSTLGGYLFVEWNGAAYALDASTSFDFESSDAGWSAALDGNRVLTGAPADANHVAPTANVGSFNTYAHDGVSFSLAALGDVIPLDLPTTELGWSVALDGTRAIVGAPGDTTAGADAGAFYEYDLSFTAWHHGFHGATSLGGSTFPPSLILIGSLCPDESFYVRVGTTPPNAPVLLIVGNQYAPAALLGGTLGPTPNLVIGGLAADGAGELAFLTPMPPVLPVGATVYLQAWVVDPTGPQGYTATNTEFLTTPF